MSTTPWQGPPHEGISVRAVARSFGSVHAVRDVSFDALPGQITGLVGPNGAGKTTLLLMLASLLAPDTGEIRVAGVDPVADPAAARARIGWMPDALGAWEALTAHETLVVAGRLYGATKPEADRRAAELLVEVGLADLSASPARVLSRGQKQLLGLARALVHRPRVLLLDEPASGLDPAARIALREMLRRLAAEGAAILISSHVLSELEEMTDAAVFMSRGATVAASGPRARDWRIRLVGDPVGARELVARALAGSEVRADRRSLLVAFADEAAAASALTAMVAAGLAVAEFAPASGALEQAFLDLKGAER
ncbi:MAG TPA: ABC transporter ATP-binding protein [Microbacterium sp.]|nr:ABC transporter ATP-binding protein [Microbacterium sp.]